MKTLVILVSLLGFTAASLLQKAAPVLEDGITAAISSMQQSGSLKEVFGMPYNDELDTLDDKIKTELGKALKEQMDNLLEKIQDKVDHGKEIATTLLQQVALLREKLKELKEDIGDKAKEILKKIKNKGKDFLKKILDKLGLGKRNMDQTLDEVFRMRFSDLIEKIKEHIVSNESIQKIKTFVANLVSKNFIIMKFKDVIKKVQDSELREVLKNILFRDTGLNKRPLKEVIQKLKDFFKKYGVEESDTITKFGEWVVRIWTNSLEKIKDTFMLIKPIATEFIGDSKDLAAKMAREVLEFFEPYKEHLGIIWDQLVEALNSIIGGVGYRSRFLE